MSDYLDIKYDKIIRKTELAILFEIGGEEHWLPKSQIENPDQLEDDGGDVSVQFWLVVEKGLEGYAS